MHSSFVNPFDIEDPDVVLNRIADAVVRTPLSAIEGFDSLVKAEYLQRSGSFKFRGAINSLRRHSPSAVVTASSGNHGRAVAIAAQSVPSVRGITVVMSEFADRQKMADVESYGARVIVAPGGNAERDLCLRTLSNQNPTWFVLPSADHADVIAGQSTAGVEIAHQIPDECVTVYVPVGGGGLLAGVLLAIRKHRPRWTVIGVEPEGADDLKRSVNLGKRVSLGAVETVCDGARAQQPGELPFAVILKLVDEVVVVADDEVLEAMLRAAEAGAHLEPTGALALAASTHNKKSKATTTIAIATGGNVTAEHGGLLAAHRHRREVGTE